MCDCTYIIGVHNDVNVIIWDMDSMVYTSLIKQCTCTYNIFALFKNYLSQLFKISLQRAALT